jgi:heat shock protein 90kDa beta
MQELYAFSIFDNLLMFVLVGLQPDNPTELSSKIYEMMSSAIGNKWTPAVESQQPVSSEPLEAKIVEEPVESGKQK